MGSKLYNYIVNYTVLDEFIFKRFVVYIIFAYCTNTLIYCIGK